MKKKIIGIFVCMLLITTCVVSVMGELITLKKSSNDINPYLKEITNPAVSQTTTGLYHTYEEMTVLLHNLAENHSDIMSLFSIGTTFEGRDLWMVKLSDNVNQEENEPGVLLMGAHHGNEKPSYEVLIYFIEFMIENYENNTNDVREVINNTQIFILPMVNPDGVEAGTRKNREPNYGPFGLKSEITSIGVDLNRNYGYKWFLLFFFPQWYLGSTDYHDTSEVYRGERPFSEKETQAIRGFVDTHEIAICITYHTYGELVMYGWGYTTRPIKDQAVAISIGENITRINNYTLEPETDLYPTLGDVCDWLYGEHDVLSFTIELAKSYAPSNPGILVKICSTHANVNLYVCQRSESL
jgi:carboxypeptidase T